jgi:hypothetical protein
VTAEDAQSVGWQRRRLVEIHPVQRVPNAVWRLRGWLVASKLELSDVLVTVKSQERA